MSEFTQFEKELLAAISADIEKVLHRIGNRLVADAVKRLRDNDKHAFGNLIDSVAYDVLRTMPLKYRIVFGSSVKGEVLRHKSVSDTSAKALDVGYAAYVEEGRQPGKIPPFEPIELWAQQKRHKFRKSGQFFGDKDISKVARAIQFKIGRKGIAPFPFLSWSVEKNWGYIEKQIASIVK